MTIRRALFGVLIACLTQSSNAETVFVKYRGSVDLAPFHCEATVSSFVYRLCYDKRSQYLLVNLKGTYYHYCELPPGVYESWRRADSLGRFYNAQIKGQYDCRINKMPEYK